MAHTKDQNDSFIKQNHWKKVLLSLPRFPLISWWSLSLSWGISRIRRKSQVAITDSKHLASHWNVSRSKVRPKQNLELNLDLGGTIDRNSYVLDPFQTVNEIMCTVESDPSVKWNSTIWVPNSIILGLILPNFNFFSWGRETISYLAGSFF